MARNFWHNFLNQMQGSFHQTPKTLAIVETSGFAPFLGELDDLAAVMTGHLDEPNFRTWMARSRSGAASFMGLGCDEGLWGYTATDLGEFLAAIKGFCKPLAGSDLQVGLDDALRPVPGRHLLSEVSS